MGVGGCRGVGLEVEWVWEEVGKFLSKLVLVFEADLYGSTYKTDAAVVRVT